MKRRHLIKMVEMFGLLEKLREKVPADFNMQKFSYFTSKNHRLADQELTDRKASLKPTEEWKKFIEKQKKLNEQYAKRDNEGKFIFQDVPNGGKSYVYDPAERIKLEAEFELFLKENEEIVKSREKVMADFEATMDEDMTPDEIKTFHRCKMENVPPNIDPVTMSPWEPFIDE